MSNANGKASCQNVGCWLRYSIEKNAPTKLPAIEVFAATFTASFLPHTQRAQFKKPANELFSGCFSGTAQGSAIQSEPAVARPDLRRSIHVYRDSRGSQCPIRIPRDPSGFAVSKSNSPQSVRVRHALATQAGAAYESSRHPVISKTPPSTRTRNIQSESVVIPNAPVRFRQASCKTARKNFISPPAHRRPGPILGSWRSYSHIPQPD